MRYPSDNEKLLSRLRWAEDPHLMLAQYLDKLWKDAKEPVARRIAMETFWHDAEKPNWVRPAIEKFFSQRSSGISLRPPDEPVDLTGRKAATPAPPAKSDVKYDSDHATDKP
jgi:hypothetical protein